MMHRTLNTCQWSSFECHLYSWVISVYWVVLTLRERNWVKALATSDSSASSDYTFRRLISNVWQGFPKSCGHWQGYSKGSGCSLNPLLCLEIQIKFIRPRLNSVSAFGCSDMTAGSVWKYEPLHLKWPSINLSSEERCCSWWSINKSCKQVYKYHEFQITLNRILMIFFFSFWKLVTHAGGRRIEAPENNTNLLINSSQVAQSGSKLSMRGESN